MADIDDLRWPGGRGRAWSRTATRTRRATRVGATRVIGICGWSVIEA